MGACSTTLKQSGVRVSLRWNPETLATESLRQDCLARSNSSSGDSSSCGLVAQTVERLVEAQEVRIRSPSKPLENSDGS